MRIPGNQPNGVEPTAGGSLSVCARTRTCRPGPGGQRVLFYAFFRETYPGERWSHETE